MPKATLTLKSNDSHTLLDVNPYSTAVSLDGWLLGDKIIIFYLPLDMPGSVAKCRVSVSRCKSCFNPRDAADIPRDLLNGVAEYVLNKYTTNVAAVPHHFRRRVAPERLKVDGITGHRFIRGRGDVPCHHGNSRWTPRSGPVAISWCTRVAPGCKTTSTVARIVACLLAPPTGCCPVSVDVGLYPLGRTV